MRSRIPDIHAVIDRALSFRSQQFDDDDGEVKKGSHASDVMNRGSRRKSRAGSLLGRSGTLIRAPLAHPAAAVEVSVRATEVTADLILGDKVQKLAA